MEPKVSDCRKVTAGRKGEAEAAEALKAKGFQIIHQNYSPKIRGKSMGEIDIIAIDGDFIVFIEVKSWSKYGLEDLEYSINHRKQQKIIKTAKYFLLENRQYNKMANRFDVVFVKENEITYLANAFMESV